MLWNSRQRLWIGLIARMIKLEMNEDVKNNEEFSTNLY